MHPRRQIRNELYDRWKNGVPIIGSDPTRYLALDVGTRLYMNRRVPTTDLDYPYAGMEIGPDNVIGMTAARDVFTRNLIVYLDLFVMMRRVEGSPDLEDTLDRLEFQANAIALYDPQLGLDFVDYVALSGSEPYEPNVDGEQYRGGTRLTYDIRYTEEVYQPGTLDEFLSFGKEIETVGGAVSEVDQTIRSA